MSGREQLRSAVLTCAGLCTVAVLAGLMVHDARFVRISNRGYLQQHRLGPADCPSGAYIPVAPADAPPVCCIGDGKQPMPCAVSSWRRAEKFLSGKVGAWALPLVGPALSAVLGAAAGGAVLRAPLQRRVAVLLVTLAFRSVVLFELLNWAQRRAQGEAPACWYAAMRKDSDGCSTRFDFSDHVVLYALHFVLPSCLELLALRTESRGGLHTALVGAWCSGLGLFALRAIFHTVGWFHTPAESLVGWSLALASCVACTQLPLYSDEQRERKHSQ